MRITIFDILWLFVRTAYKKNKIFKFLLNTDKNVIIYLQMGNRHNYKYL